jgi:hypothetical protein
MIGYAFYLKTKKIKGTDIRGLAGLCIFLNAIFILVCICMAANDRSLIKIWGYKFDKEIVLYCFKNPNSESLFLFLCILSIWLFCKKKLLRIIIVAILAYISFRLTYGRTFFFAEIGLILADMLMNKNRMKFLRYILMSVPVVVFVLSLGVGLIAMNYSIEFYDLGLLGRFLYYGRSLSMMTFSYFIFGMPEEKINFAFDGSFFVLFVTMGFFMFVYLLKHYIKYIKKLDDRYSDFAPAIFCLILGGVTESLLAYFSVNTFFLITLLVSLRKIRLECDNDNCSRI